MAELAEGSPVVLAPVRPRPNTSIPRLVLGLLPIWIFVTRAIAFPDANEPLFANPPAVFGFPLGLWLLGFSLALMAVGAAVLAKTTSRKATTYAFAFLTAPSTALIVLAPAIILLIISLSPQTGAMP